MLLQFQKKNYKKIKNARNREKKIQGNQASTYKKKRIKFS